MIKAGKSKKTKGDKLVDYCDNSAEIWWWLELLCHYHGTKSGERCLDLGYILKDLLLD